MDWNVLNVHDMSFMFANTEVFNGNLTLWKVSNVVDMHDMFHGAYAFNHDPDTLEGAHTYRQPSLYFPTPGGTFAGERLRGQLLAGGSDCQLMRTDGVADLDVRISMQCDDGTIVFMKGLGMRHGPAEVMKRLADGEDVDPSEYYFREAILFEAPPGDYVWLNRVLAIGSGRRDPDLVTVDVFEVM